MLQKICSLLDSPDNMRRCGAAIVLAELAPKDPAAVKALGESLQHANQTLTPYVLDALESIGSRDAVSYVMPLLDVEDVATQLRVAGIISKAGSAALPEITRLIEGAPRRRKMVLTEILGRIHTRNAFKLILNQLLDADLELVKETCDAVRRHISEVAPKDRATLHKQVVEFLAGPRVKKSERAQTSCLLLLGYIGDPAARVILLKHSKPDVSTYVRRHALIGLKSLDYTATQSATVARAAFGYLDDDDPGIIQHAMDILERLPSASATAAQWRKLLDDKHARIRSFAASRLAETDTAAGNRLLLGLLNHDDGDVRAVAANALSRHEKATSLLLDTLANEPDAEMAWRLARILESQVDAIDTKALEKITSLAAADLQAGNPRHEPLLYLIRAVDPAAVMAILRAAGLKFRRAKKWTQAVECLRRLLRTEIFDDEISYALSISDLKLSAKEIAPHFRAQDHALRGLQALLHGGVFKLLDHLKKDASLDANDLYYIGFHFTERIGLDMEFGADVLEHVTKTWPRSAEGKDAKIRLKVVRPASKKTAATRKKAKKK